MKTDRNTIERRPRSAEPVKCRKGLYILASDTFPLIYGPEEQREIAEYLDIYAAPQTRDSIRANRHLLADAEVILTGWGAPRMDEDFLAAAPKLKAVFHGAGTIGYFTTEAFWRRNITVCTANVANGIPVAEYTVSLIQLSLKRFWHLSAHAKRGGSWFDPARQQLPGAYGSTVGLVSLGVIGQLVRERLRSLDVRLIAYDPLATEADVPLVPLEELFRRADVVSLHAPCRKETVGMITGAHIASMKPGATFINTARGAIVCEAEMAAVLRQRPDLTAVLDVCDPEPPPPDSPLLSLPNVVVTPHIAGSLGPECRRMGRYMVEELRRYVAGEPLRWHITKEVAARLA